MESYLDILLYILALTISQFTLTNIQVSPLSFYCPVKLQSLHGDQIVYSVILFYLKSTHRDFKCNLYLYLVGLCTYFVFWRINEAKTSDIFGLFLFLHLVRERPFNLKGGLCFFFLKKYSDSQCCWKKYSDFGGGKKNNLIQSFCHIT
jgi:hypothetical protein